ncbi:hypothetical protein BC834DRAFT_421618 [Gloeopeniophorella convolvens]|nr:hypothetical protein BC834DRAFT_421618 [Gloeopeniophorella convolvens]
MIGFASTQLPKQVSVRCLFLLVSVSGRLDPAPRLTRCQPYLLWVVRSNHPVAPRAPRSFRRRRYTCRVIEAARPTRARALEADRTPALWRIGIHQTMRKFWKAAKCVRPLRSAGCTLSPVLMCRDAHCSVGIITLGLVVQTFLRRRPYGYRRRLGTPDAFGPQD